MSITKIREVFSLPNVHYAENVQEDQSQGTKSHYGGTFSYFQMLYTGLYRLFEAQQIILYEISSIAAVNNKLCGR